METLKVNNRIVYTPVIGRRDGLKDWRNAWGEVANRHLALACHAVRIDMRSFKDQGIDREPEQRRGSARTAIARRSARAKAAE